MRTINNIILFSLLSVFNQNLDTEMSQDKGYFPLDIEKKIIHFGGYDYEEYMSGTKVIGNKQYTEYTQRWEAGNETQLYLRKENGKVLQYEECCDEDTIRYDESFLVGDTWLTVDSKTRYTIVTYDGKLDTPFFNYEKLLVIKAELSNTIYHFYYKKDYGYVGATQNNKLVSYLKK